MGAQNLEVRQKLIDSFNNADSLVYLRAHWDILDGKPLSYTPAPHVHSEFIYYVAGNTTGTAGTWTGTISGLAAYYDGLTIRFRIGIAGASTTTLNINGLGAVTVQRYVGSSNITTHFPVNAVITMTKVGSSWVVQDWYDSTDDYGVRWINNVTAGTTITRYKIIMQAADGKFYPLTINDSTAVDGKVVSTQEFLVNGLILQYNSNGTTYTVGQQFGSYYLWSQQYNSDIVNYTFNTLSGWVASVPIYLKGTIQTNGTFKLNNTTLNSWLTQTLPTTDDGFVYIKLGYMHNTTTAYTLTIDHPAYEYKDGKLRLYVPTHTHAYLSDADETVTNAKLAHIASQTIKGRATASTGDVEDLSAAQVKVILSLNNVYNYGLATQAEAEAGTLDNEYMTPLRTRQAIDNRAGSIIFNNANGGNFGGTYYSAKQNLTVAVGATRWCHLASFNGRSSGKIMYELTGTDVEEFGIIEFKTSYYTDGCQLTISRQSYNPKIRTVAIYGNNGSVKNIYLEVDAGTYARYLGWRVLDSSDAIVNIYNAVSSPAGVYTTGDPVILTAGYVGNIRISSERDVALPSVEKTTDYGIEVNDAGKTFHMNATITKSFFINTNANAPLPIGTEINFVRYGTGDVEIYPDTGVTILSESSKRRINARYQVVTIKKLDTNTWLLFGALKS